MFVRAFVTVSIFVFILTAAGFPTAFGQPPSGNPPSFKDVAPIFQSYCVQCHGAAKAAKGVRTDSYAGLMIGTKGGEAVVVPGKPGKSAIFLRITGAEKPRMPKNGPPWLSPEEASLVEKWISSGAAQ